MEATAGKADQSSGGSSHSSTGGAFPVLTAEALDRTPITLPAQFEGQLNLLLISWAPDQAGQVDSWTSVAQALQHASFGFRVYRMPVSGRENALYRWWDNSSLRSAELDPEMLHWTVPLYTDKPSLRRALGFPENEHSIAAALVDHAGHVLWRDQGASTDAGRAGLLAAAKNAP